MPLHNTYSEHELRNAHRVLPFALAGIGFEQALADPLYRPVLEAKAASHRQILRDLARRAEQMRAGRWLDRSAIDAYDFTDRTADLNEVPA